MTQALSTDIRERVLAAIAGGLSGRRAAERFAVSPASVSRWRKLLREQGSVAARPQGGDRKSQRLEAHADAILKAVDEKVDITLAELQEKLRTQGVIAGRGSIWRFFQRHNITRKKRRRMRPSSGAAR